MKEVNLINQHFLEKKLKESKEQVQDNSTIFLKWHNDNRKEEAVQSDFLNDIFGKILGYEIETDKEYNLDKEYKTQKDGTKVDGVLGFFTKESKNVKAIVELKGKNTKNLDEVEKQAFEYRDKIDGIEFVVTSNTEEIRLYSAKSGGRLKYQSWMMKELSESLQKQKEFHFLLCKQNLIGIEKQAISNTKKLIEEDIKREDEIKAKFYQEYKALREEFVKDILKQNTVSNDDAISKTQKLLDRLLFIRFCEDNNFITKPFEKVDFAKQLGFPLWDSMKQLFIAIDKGNPPHIHKFNGGLFREDESFNNLKISTNLLEKLIGFLRLYHFKNDISVHILGHIFEQSITDLEALKAGLSEENFDKKQGKRKKDGIFYTPEYITKYIVEEAVGGWLNDRKTELGILNLPELNSEEKSFISKYNNELFAWCGTDNGKLVEVGNVKGAILAPSPKIKKQDKPIFQSLYTKINAIREYSFRLMEIKVLDPACGSGAFLVEVFNFLENEWDWVNKTLKFFGGGLFQIQWNYRSLLKNNIYGVDLNQESVQITKLSLWLKTANLNDELTTLDNNIKCGNSLIDDPEVAGNKAFNWEKEFPFKFDVVVGNPPYVFARGGNFSDTTKEYYYKNYKFTDYQINTYLLFIEQGCNLLNNGRLGFIVPNNWLTINTFANLRKFVLEQTANTVIINTFGDVFEGASVDSCILTFAKDKAGQEITLGKMTDGKIEASVFNKNEIAIGDDKVININQASNKNGFDIIKKINENSVELDTICSVLTGVKCYQTGKGEPKQNDDIKNSRAYHSQEKQNDTYIKYLEGSDVSRYSLTWSGEYLSYGKWIAEPRFSAKFKDERILVRQIPSKLPYAINAVFTNEEFINDINSMIIQDLKVNPMFVLAILNCKLTSFWFDIIFNKFSRTIFPQFKINELKKFPIPQIPLTAQQLFIEKAQTMLDLTKQLNDKTKAFVDYFVGKFKAKLPADKEFKITRNLENWHTLEFTDFIKELSKQKIKFSSTDEYDLKPLFDREKKVCVELQTQITKTDAEIDKMVYALYGLSEEEVRVVENLVV